MKLVVGFLAYNEVSAKYLGEFLPSLKKALNFFPQSEFKILAFDNSEEDTKINRLAIEFFFRENPEEVEYYSQGKNLGFGAAYNFLINKAKELGADYFLMLNPDTCLAPDAISLLMTVLEERKELAAASPKILRWNFLELEKTKQIDSVGLVLKSGLKFIDLGQGEEDKGQYDQAEILGPSGAAGLFRLSALEAIKEKDNYFDEQFFMYKEDCDLAYRLDKNNLKSALVPEAIVYHDRTAAFYGRGIRAFFLNRRQLSKRVRAWSFRSQHFLFIKHFKNENLASRLLVLNKVFILFFFSLILEQFNLKEYKNIVKYWQSID